MTSEDNKRVYERYIGLLNAQDFGSLAEVVDPERYREICVGFTPGWVDLPDAVASLQKVVGGIPDLNARIDDLISEDDKADGDGHEHGALLRGSPTGRSYEANMFDYARIEDGRSSSASSSPTPSPSSRRCTVGRPRRPPSAPASSEPPSSPSGDVAGSVARKFRARFPVNPPKAPTGRRRPGRAMFGGAPEGSGLIVTSI